MADVKPTSTHQAATTTTSPAGSPIITSMQESAGQSPVTTELTPSDKLAFLRDYIVRSRFDVMVDKQTLTQLFYIKLAMFAAVATAIASPIGVIAVLSLPIGLFTVDYLHKKRFLEIFIRWKQLHEQVEPRLRALPGFWREAEFETLEKQIFGARDRIAAEEARIRWISPAATGLLGMPLFPLLATNVLNLPAGNEDIYLLIWCGILVAFCWYLFCFNGPFKSTYPLRSWSLPLVFIFGAVTFICLQNSETYDLLGTYESVFTGVAEQKPILDPESP